MTDKERADVLREAADIMDDEGLTESLSLWDRDHQCDYMRACADRLDPPQPKQGLIVFENGTHGFVLRGHMSVDHKWDIVTDFGELLTFDDAMPFRPANLCFIDHDETAITIPPLSELPEGCEFVRVVLLFESETGRTLKETFGRIFDRDDIQRMQDKKSPPGGG